MYIYMQSYVRAGIPGDLNRKTIKKQYYKNKNPSNKNYKQERAKEVGKERRKEGGRREGEKKEERNERTKEPEVVFQEICFI